MCDGDAVPARLRDALHAADPGDRVGAVQELLRHAARHPRARRVGSELLRRRLAVEGDAWPAVAAARALAQLADADVGREAWLDLLRRPDATLVARVALACADPALVPALLDLVATHPDAEVRICAIRTLGRSRTPVVLPALVGALADPTLRAHTVAALADLGDPRAVPHLALLLADATEAWPEDDHGPMLRVRDLAEDAIRRIRGGRA